MIGWNKVAVVVFGTSATLGGLVLLLIAVQRTYEHNTLRRLQSVVADKVTPDAVLQREPDYLVWSNACRNMELQLRQIESQCPVFYYVIAASEQRGWDSGIALSPMPRVRAGESAQYLALTDNYAGSAAVALALMKASPVVQRAACESYEARNASERASWVLMLRMYARAILGNEAPTDPELVLAIDLARSWCGIGGIRDLTRFTEMEQIVLAWAVRNVPKQVAWHKGSISKGPSLRHTWASLLASEGRYLSAHIRELWRDDIDRKQAQFFLENFCVLECTAALMQAKNDNHMSSLGAWVAQAPALRAELDQLSWRFPHLRVSVDGYVWWEALKFTKRMLYLLGVRAIACAVADEQSSGPSTAVVTVDSMTYTVKRSSMAGPQAVRYTATLGDVPELSWLRRESFFEADGKPFPETVVLEW